MSTKEGQLVRIQLRYPDEETFVARFAANVTRGGIFLASRTPRPPGEVVRFEIGLSTGPALLAGTGRVTWVRDFNPDEPHRAHGMGVQFISLAPHCQGMLERLLQRKTANQSAGAASGVPSSLALRSDSGATSCSTSADAQNGADSETWADDSSVRRAIDRARGLAATVEDIEALLARIPDDPVSLPQAIGELQRSLYTRRPSGAVRVQPEAPAAATKDEKNT